MDIFQFKVCFKESVFPENTLITCLQVFTIKSGVFKPWFEVKFRHFETIFSLKKKTNFSSLRIKNERHHTRAAKFEILVFLKNWQKEKSIYATCKTIDTAGVAY
jgi:hypothetical protein